MPELLENYFFRNHHNDDYHIYKTNLRELDCILGGGLSPGITEIYGPYSSGKTHLALKIISSIQPAVIIDCDHSIYIERLKQLNIDYQELYVCQPRNIKEIFSIVKDCFDNKIAVFIDSLGSILISQDDIFKLADHLQKLSKQGLCIITNFFNNHKSPGGNVFNFYTTTRIKLDVEKYLPTGQITEVTVTKNKLARPFEKTSIFITYNHGVNDTYDILQTMIRKQEIIISSSFYYYKGKQIGHGIKQTLDYINSHIEKYYV